MTSLVDSYVMARCALHVDGTGVEPDLSDVRRWVGEATRCAMLAQRVLSEHSDPDALTTPTGLVPPEAQASDTIELDELDFEPDPPPRAMWRRPNSVPPGATRA